MSTIVIQCANCGAKYKLPETFHGEKAKCKQCGSQIDVKAARAAPPAPAGAKPVTTPKPATTVKPVTAARPAPAVKPAPEPQPAERAGSLERPRRAASGASSRRGRDGDAEGEAGHGARGRRGAGRHGHREGADKKKSPALLIGGIAGGVAVLGLVGWLVFGGKKEPEKNDAASNTPPVNAQGSNGAGGHPSAPKDEPKKSEPAVKETPKAEMPELEFDKKKDDKAQSRESAKGGETPKDANANKGDKKKSGKQDLTSRDQVYDQKKELKPLEYEASVTDEQKIEFADLLETMVSGGAVQKNKAKKKLVEAGHPAMIAIINKLREFDYFDAEQSMTAFELNKLMETEMTYGLNAMFKPVTLGDTIDFNLADWNAQTVKNWQELILKQYPTKEKFDAMVKARKTRHTEEDKKKDDGDK